VADNLVTNKHIDEDNKERPKNAGDQQEGTRTGWNIRTMEREAVHLMHCEVWENNKSKTC